MPLTLTTNAIEKLEEDLERTRAKPTEVFRLMANRAGRVAVRLDEPTPDDLVLRHGGTALLAVAPGLADRLANSALDVGKTADDPEWVVVRRGASS